MSTTLEVEAIEARALVRALLEEQHQLTAVEEFARAHRTAASGETGARYRALIPGAAPAAGQQYAFEVELDDCTGCKSCVAACHNLNGLDDGETWRRVSVLHGGGGARALRQTITAACHHCLEPACMNGCPARAYVKDPRTGIVHHLDDQCIGCKYCLFTCPYEVPRYDRSRGIVRKCNMCAGRLAAAEPPACVEACPTGAIRIRVVDEAAIVDECEDGGLVPASPPSRLTLPTTRYRSARPLPRNALPADYHVVRRGDAHLPLVVMLVLTQLAVGVVLVAALVGDAVAYPEALVTLGVAGTALAASTLHLGRPRYAHRALLGLRTSWLSREVLAFGVFVALAGAQALALALDRAPPSLLPWAAAAVGAVAVQTSVMVYVVTRREVWSATTTAISFFGTVLVGGSSAWLAIVAVAAAATSSPVPVEVGALARVLAVTAALRLGFELWLVTAARKRTRDALARRAALLLGELRPWAQLRLLGGALGGVILPLALADSAGAVAGAGVAALAVMSALVTVAAELVERHLFFVAAPPTGPGAAS